MQRYLDQDDLSRVRELIFSHLHTQQLGICLTLIRMVKLSMIRNQSIEETREILVNTSAEVKQLLLVRRHELENEVFNLALDLYEESLTLPVTHERSVSKEEFSSKKFLTTSEVAEKIGVSNQTILNMIKDGRIVAERPLGGHYRIPADQFEESDRDIENFNRVVDELNATINGNITDEDLESL
ncbi:MAG TPA: excisionase family DNA-binding protein [Bacilli bacterium]|nr:excisionase family DNA-binding protein [Bacilli bacterium]